MEDERRLVLSAKMFLLPAAGPSRKNFCIDQPENLSFDPLCDRLLAYLEQNHPDASVVIARPFRSVMPAASIVLTLGGLWIDRDSVFWLFDKAAESLATRYCQSWQKSGRAFDE